MKRCIQRILSVLLALCFAFLPVTDVFAESADDPAVISETSQELEVLEVSLGEEPEAVNADQGETAEVFEETAADETVEPEGYMQDVPVSSVEQKDGPVTEASVLPEGTDEVPNGSVQIPEYTFYLNQGSGILIRFDGTAAPTGILVDGQAVPEEETDVFLAKTGRVHVAIFRTYLDQLTVGDHAVTIECPDGQRQAVLHIEASTVTRTEPVVLNVEFECKAGDPVTLDIPTGMFSNGQGDVVKLSWEEDGLFTQYNVSSQLASFDSVNIKDGTIRKAIHVKDESEEDQFIGIGDDAVVTEWSSDYPSSSIRQDKYYSLTLLISGASELDPDFDNFIINAPGSVAAHARRGPEGYDMVFVTVYYKPSGDEPFRFTDVQDPKAFYYDPVYWAVDRGITTGFTDKNGNLTGLFGPDSNCTRGQIATFLYRYKDQPAINGSYSFKDVKENAYYYKAAVWAAEQGITTGYSDKNGKPTGKFGPNDYCTRAQVVTFLYRLAGSPKVKSTSATTFKDVSKKAYYHDAVVWAAKNGITTGYTNSHGKPTGYFGSDDVCTRGQVVTFLYRYYLAEQNGPFEDEIDYAGMGFYGFILYMLEQPGLDGKAISDLERAKEVMENAMNEDMTKSTLYSYSGGMPKSRNNRVVVLDDPKDAVDLSNVQKTFDIMREINTLRTSDENYAAFDLQEGYVCFYSMAVAQCAANRAAFLMNHSILKMSSENIAWGYSDPNGGWYTTEKRAFDAVRDELGYHAPLTQKQISKIVSVCSSRGIVTGHYTNLLMFPDQVMGVGYNLYSSYGRTWSFNSGSATSYGEIMKLYTIDEFETMFNTFMSNN